MITLATISRLRGIRHGFLTRRSGVSTGLYAGLNCGFGSGDDPALVERNRALALERLGVPGAVLLGVHQIHSATVVVAESAWTREQAPKADALVTRQRGLCLGILTADCVPVLFADPSAGVIGAAHAGWRGAVNGVLEATIAAMVTLGADQPNIRAAIGPAIRQNSYEVGPEFPAPFLAVEPTAERFFGPSLRPRHLMFDLPGFVSHRLERLALASIEDTGLDTCGDALNFYSYRRSVLRGERDYGRLLSAIVLTP